jgi:hypothetical protein
MMTCHDETLQMAMTSSDADTDMLINMHPKKSFALPSITSFVTSPLPICKHSDMRWQLGI